MSYYSACFFIFLMNSGPFNGSTMLFNKAIRSFMDRYGSQITQAMDEAGQFEAQVKKKALDMTVDHLTKSD